MPTIRETAFQNLNIPSGNKVILALDGGGMRGIFAVELLKKIEQIAGAPAYQWCDMVAGTSTGAIISGLIHHGYSAPQIENYYMQLVSQVFTKRSIFANRFLNPPAFDKKNYRSLLKGIIGDVTLQDGCMKTGLDIMITSKDLAAGEETFFTCFNNGGIKGTYKDVLLRAVMEATMSAPTYFQPFERFVDGGTTTFNNPAGAAVLEALCYEGKGKYQSDKLTVFSLGTCTVLRFVNLNEIADPKGPDVAFWLNYVMDESSKDASEMQIDMLRSGFFTGLDFRRFQVSLDETTMKKLPDRDLSQLHDVNANTLHTLTNDELSKIDMADVTKFPLMKIIGDATVEYICPTSEINIPRNQRKGNWFTKDLVNEKGRDQLLTAMGDVAAIQQNLSSAAWVNAVRTA